MCCICRYSGRWRLSRSALCFSYSRTVWVINGVGPGGVIKTDQHLSSFFGILQ
jgi:hypothetical protein